MAAKVDSLKKELCIGKKPEGKGFPGFSEQEEGTWNGPYVFILAADPQFGLIDGWNGVPEDESTWDKEIVLTNKAVDCINALRPQPKFVSICGDLVDAAPGTEKHELQIVDFLKCIQSLKPEIPVINLPGNHDIGNTPTEESVQNYKNDFGDDYYSFVAGGVFYIVVNNQFYKDCSSTANLFEEHEKWLEKQLAIAKSKKFKQCVMFQHIPWFHHDIEEEEDYFNIDLIKRKELISKFKNVGIQHAFAGHYHQNAGGYDGDFEMTVSSAIGCQIGNDLSGVRIVRVFENKIDHKYYDFDNFPSEVSLDENICLP